MPELDIYPLLPKARKWVDSFALYIDAEHEPHPVAKAATYLRDAAQDWWHEAKLPTTATWQQFTSQFLARFVKPSDSAKARAELPNLKQGWQGSIPEPQSCTTGSAESQSLHVL